MAHRERIGVFMTIGGLATGGFIAMVIAEGQANLASWQGYALRNHWLLWTFLAVAVVSFLLALREGEWFRRFVWRVWPWVVPMAKPDVVILTKYPIELSARQEEMTLIEWVNRSMPTEKGRVRLLNGSIHLDLQSIAGPTTSRVRREIRLMP